MSGNIFKKKRPVKCKNKGRRKGDSSIMVYALLESSTRGDGNFDPQFDSTLLVGIYGTLEKCHDKMVSRIKQIQNENKHCEVNDYGYNCQEVSIYRDEEMLNVDFNYSFTIQEQEVE